MSIIEARTRDTMRQNVWINVLSEMAFTTALTGLTVAWDYQDGTPIHIYRDLASYSTGGVVIFLIRQFRSSMVSSCEATPIVNYCYRLALYLATFLSVVCLGALQTRAVGVTVEATPASGYQGIWYCVGPKFESYGYKYSGGMATYCAKHSPFAVCCPQVEKTFFTYGGTADDSFTSLRHMVGFFDHRTGQVSRPRMLLDKHTKDAHDNPILSVDDAGHVWIFSTSHGRGRPSYIHRSVEPFSIDRFERVDASYKTDDGPKPLDNFSYMQTWHTPKYGFVSFFTHYGDPADRTSMFMTSSDGRTWSAWTRLAAIEKGHYQISAADDDRAATLFNYHPAAGGLDSRTNLYYLQTRDGGSTWTDAAGVAVSLPVTTPDNAALVHDFASAGRNVYVKDLRFAPDGQPVALVVTSGGHEPGPANDPRLWEMFCWERGAWRKSVVGHSDHNYDMGSLYFEPGRWRVIAPTDPGPQPHGTGGEVVSWSSNDEGRTWRRDGPMTSGSKLNHSYIRRPVNAHDDFYALWADGNAAQPSVSRLYFCNKAGEVYQLPFEMQSDFATPQAVISSP